ncbi:hypothetical protein HMPREF1544_03879 [Mucor circinelloides 1006PhL]|uniref:SWI5-dependent HO expression protein 3 n=1 Tax=Mucor circinelloides f. circinelloides (strain 1006PhL) TaxID=1220926 RepID=S2KAB3_MUCC1|nr:hypothetical protein HMPREF1544_03879 [Mucor circinelloides 1006PhL]
MLHVQESFINSSLLMTPPMTVIVQPQPSSSSRSNKVIEQLSNKYELIQKDLAATRAQLEIMRQTKLKHEKDTINYTNSNKVYRNRIKEIMQVLESKQKALEGTKGSSSQLELKVKQLKDEALASRRQLEDLRRREQVLEHDRDVAVKEKNQIKYKQHVLQDSIDQLRVRCDREVALLQKDHSILIDQARYITERNEHMIELISLKLKQRRQHIEHLALMKRQLRSNTEAFVQDVRNHLQALKTEIDESALHTKDCTLAAIQCRGEVNGLVTRIKTIAAEITASEEQQR